MYSITCKKVIKLSLFPKMHQTYSTCYTMNLDYLGSRTLMWFYFQQFITIPKAKAAKDLWAVHTWNAASTIACAVSLKSLNNFNSWPNSCTREPSIVLGRLPWMPKLALGFICGGRVSHVLCIMFPRMKQSTRNLKMK